MRFIIECDSIEDMLAGVASIKFIVKDENSTKLNFVRVGDGSEWIVRETKTGYSSRRYK